MLDKIAKLEAAINKVLTLLFGRIANILAMLIPNSLKQKYYHLVNKITDFFLRSKSKLKETIVKSYQFIKKIINGGFDFLTKVQNYPIKEKVSELILKAKLYYHSRTPREHLKYFYNEFKNWNKTRQENKKSKQKRKTPYLIWSGLCSIVIMGSIGVYYSAQDIYKKEYPSRSIASVQEYDHRPEYRLYEQKTIHIRNVKLPVFVESIAEMDSITIDFSVRTSTRFARYFLEEYEYKLKDYFFTGMEPIISDFPIEQEGKSIVKEVIIQEINLFLKDNHVEGEVEEVNILYLIGS